MTAPNASPVPHGATALRPAWQDLPEEVRGLIETRLGGAVLAVSNQGSGFSQGFASRLLFGEGERAFVKAVGEETSPSVADSYRAEARIVPLLPPEASAPALRWTLDEGGWVVLCFDDVPGRPPARPWDPAELTRALTSVTTMAEALTPGPAGLLVPEARDWLREDFGYWRELADGSDSPDPQVAELAALEDQALEALHGESVIHCDLRDDNVIIGDDGRVWFCDWNWPSRGAAWFDLLTLLISARGDGYDADALFAAHPLGAGVEPEEVDAVLAALSGTYLRGSLLPVVSGSPHLRAHQASYAETTLTWLALRRGWVG